MFYLTTHSTHFIYGYIAWVLIHDIESLNNSAFIKTNMNQCYI